MNIPIRYLILFATAFSLFACNESEHKEAIELNNRAMVLYRDSTNIDSAIILLDKAIEFDSEYFGSYYNKMIFLFEKKDFDKTLSNNAKMIELQPDQPMWVSQRGLLFELKGDTLEAKKHYQEGLIMYEEKLIENDTWQFKLEYVGALIMAGKPNEAAYVFQNLKEKYPKEEVVQEYKLETKTSLIEQIKKH
jgi:tetratricopeptide (TPR) repeat protein